MKVLYISSTSSGMHQKSIYFDLMMEFVNKGHEVYVAYAREKRQQQTTAFYHQNGIQYLGIKTGNISKNKNFIEKGISTLTIDPLFKQSIAKYLSNVSFDLVLYSTPPITFTKTLKYLKSINKTATFYLMLKDIFPQNAIDLGLMKNDSLVHKLFKGKERKVYELSDVIGVMSPANRDFMAKHHPAVFEKVELLPNTITPKPIEITYRREDFGLSENKTVLLFGGNLGAPQAIPFVIECFKELERYEHIEIVIAGSGGKENLIKDYVSQNKHANVKYLGQLDNEKYNQLTYLCDIGLIFLDYRFTIPNYPQRILSYLEAKKPVVCATDPNTDIGKMSQANGYGISVMSNDSKEWINAVVKLAEDKSLQKQMGESGYQFLLDNYQSSNAYHIIMSHLEKM